MRAMIVTIAKRRISALPSQRVLISGRARPCSIANAASSRGTAPARLQPTQRASAHQTIRPSPSTAASRAAPVANNAKVTKSSGSNAFCRCVGGSGSAAIAASDSSASPSSKRYSACHCDMASSSGENSRASGVAHCGMPMPSTTPFSRHFAGNDCIM